MLRVSWCLRVFAVSSVTRAQIATATLRMPLRSTRSITYLEQDQSVGRDRESGRSANRSLEQFLDLLHLSTTASYLQQCTHHAPDHMVKESVGFDGKSNPPRSDTQFSFEYVTDCIPVAGCRLFPRRSPVAQPLRLAEAGEVVPALEGFGCASHDLQVQWVGIVVMLMGRGGKVGPHRDRSGIGISWSGRNAARENRVAPAEPTGLVYRGAEDCSTPSPG